MPYSSPDETPALLLWDVFCRVIDNFGDIGVCWRLCADLAQRGHRVRLWVDDSSALHWMAPGAVQGQWTGVQVLDWADSTRPSDIGTLPPADVWIEGFGCEIAAEFIAHFVALTRARGLNDQQQIVWINLEYLSAEPYVERSHGLPSPVLQGPARGWTKHFYYPGFTAGTGGLLRETGVMDERHGFDHGDQRAQWLAQQGIPWAGERLVSLFCYEPPALAALLAQLAALPGRSHVLVTPGRATAAVRAALAATDGGPLTQPPVSVAGHSPQQLRVSYLSVMPQPEFDRLLWACDLNCVRGEDSVVRALWAGKPFLWHIYPQHDAAHVAKLDAFLDVLGADPLLRAMHQAWNGNGTNTSDPALHLMDLKLWAENVVSARQRLLEMDDLTTQLLQFVQKKR